MQDFVQLNEVIKADQQGMEFNNGLSHDHGIGWEPKIHMCLEAYTIYSYFLAAKKYFYWHPLLKPDLRVSTE